jgi:hypothetical protein
MKTFTFFIVEVDGCSREEAERVMSERLDHDEDYGFDYKIDWESIPPGIIKMLDDAVAKASQK